MEVLLRSPNPQLIFPAVLALALGAVSGAGLAGELRQSAPGPHEQGGKAPRVTTPPAATPAPPKQEEWGEPDFASFYRDLKSALARHDAAAMALLVDFPLHLNHTDGSETALANARALEVHFDDAFPPDLRRLIAREPEANLIRVGTDLGLVNGTVWATIVGSTGARRYRVTQVNPEAGQNAAPAAGLQAVCETAKHRVVIDAAPDGGGGLRNRVWNKPHFPPGAPDLEVTGGRVTSAGSDNCVHDIWTFGSGDTEYTLTEMRCDSGSMPEDARATLEVATKAQVKQSWWCF
jgi:hypothetical protein